MIKVADIEYVRFAAPDLPRMEQFLVDFGLSRVESDDGALYMRGTGTSPWLHQTVEGEAGFRGVGFDQMASIAGLFGNHTTLLCQYGRNIQLVSHQVKPPQPKQDRKPRWRGTQSATQYSRAPVSLLYHGCGIPQRRG